MTKLGERVKDTVTDFEGMAIARCVYLNGCVRIQVQPKELKDGKIIEGEWIDEGQLVIFDDKKKFNRTALDEEEENGGPGSMPPKMSHP
jgi:hypothetical protein